MVSVTRHQSTPYSRRIRWVFQRCPRGSLMTDNYNLDLSPDSPVRFPSTPGSPFQDGDGSAGSTSGGRPAVPRGPVEETYLEGPLTGSFGKTVGPSLVRPWPVLHRSSAGTRVIDGWCPRTSTDSNAPVLSGGGGGSALCEGGHPPVCRCSSPGSSLLPRVVRPDGSTQVGLIIREMGRGSGT